MKILTAMLRARDDGTVSSHYRAQGMTGEDVPKMLRAIRDDINKELELVENCPAVRAKFGDGAPHV